MSSTFRSDIICFSDWKNILGIWKEEANKFNDDLGYLNPFHCTDSNDKVSVVYRDDVAVMATHIFEAALPHTVGKTLRSTHFVFSPEIEFVDDNNDLLEMYTHNIKAIYKYSSVINCQNIKIYTPRDLDMKLWKTILVILNDSEQREVIHQGRWTTLLLKRG